MVNLHKQNDHFQRIPDIDHFSYKKEYNSICNYIQDYYKDDMDKPLEHYKVWTDGDGSMKKLSDIYTNKITMINEFDEDNIPVMEDQNLHKVEEDVKVICPNDSDAVHSGVIDANTTELKKVINNQWQNKDYKEGDVITEYNLHNLDDEQIRNINMLCKINFLTLGKFKILDGDKALLMKKCGNADGDWIKNRNTTYVCGTGLEYRISRFNMNQINTMVSNSDRQLIMKTHP
jgi:hypothetical protein